MRYIRFTAVVLVAEIAAALPAHAQSPPPDRQDPAALVVPGLMYAWAVFGDDDPQSDASTGFSVGVQIRGARSGRVAWTIEATILTNAPNNPHFDERFAPFSMQIGGQIGRRTYIRPSGGMLVVGGIAPIFGIAVGHERRTSRGLVGALEFVVRAGGVVGAAGWMAGWQVPIGRSIAPDQR